MSSWAPEVRSDPVTLAPGFRFRSESFKVLRRFAGSLGTIHTTTNANDEEESNGLINRDKPRFELYDVIKRRDKDALFCGPESMFEVIIIDGWSIGPKTVETVIELSSVIILFIFPLSQSPSRSVSSSSCPQYINGTLKT